MPPRLTRDAKPRRNAMVKATEGLSRASSSISQPSSTAPGSAVQPRKSPGGLACASPHSTMVPVFMIKPSRCFGQEEPGRRLSACWSAHRPGGGAGGAHAEARAEAPARTPAEARAGPATPASVHCPPAHLCARRPCAGGGKSVVGAVLLHCSRCSPSWTWTAEPPDSGNMSRYPTASPAGTCAGHRPPCG